LVTFAKDVGVDLFADPGGVVVVCHRGSGTWVDVDFGAEDLSPVGCIVGIGKRRE